VGSIEETTKEIHERVFDDMKKKKTNKKK